MLFTSCQIRASRAMLRLSIQELSRRSGVSERTLKRIEGTYGIPPNTEADTHLKLFQYFTGEGLNFAPEIGDERGPGVFYGRYPGRVIPKVP